MQQIHRTFVAVRTSTVCTAHDHVFVRRAQFGCDVGRGLSAGAASVHCIRLSRRHSSLLPLSALPAALLLRAEFLLDLRPVADTARTQQNPVMERAAGQYEADRR